MNEIDRAAYDALLALKQDEINQLHKQLTNAIERAVKSEQELHKVKDEMWQSACTIERFCTVTTPTLTKIKNRLIDLCRK